MIGGKLNFVKNLRHVNPIAQDPEGNTPYLLRQKELRSIAEYMVLLMGMEKKIKEHANNVIKSGTADVDCKSFARNVNTRTVPTAQLKKYIDATKKCWAWKNDLILSFMCGICDPNSDTNFDIGHNKITLSNKTCKFYIDNCFHSIWLNFMEFFPYLRELSDLSICNDQGQKIRSKHQYRLWTKDSRMDTEDCARDPNKCKGLCDKSMSLFTPSYESEGDPDFLRGIVWNLADTFKFDVDKTPFEIAKNVAKIRTDNENQADETRKAEEKAREAASSHRRQRKQRVANISDQNNIINYPRLLLLQGNNQIPWVTSSQPQAFRYQQSSTTAPAATTPAATTPAATTPAATTPAATTPATPAATTPATPAATTPAAATTTPAASTTPSTEPANSATALASSTQSLLEGNPYTVSLEFNDSGYPITMYNLSPRMMKIKMADIWTKDNEDRALQLYNSGGWLLSKFNQVFVMIIIVLIN